MGDGQERDEGFAGASWQDDDAAAGLVPPRVQRFTLMRERLARRFQLALQRLIIAGFVEELDLLLAQFLDDGAIVPSLGTIGRGARIELAARQELNKRVRSS